MIYLTPRAEKDLKALSRGQRARILSKLKALDFSPGAPHVKKLAALKGKGIDIYRARVGVYRVLYTLDEEKVVIFRIVHRRDLDRVIKGLSHS